MSHDELENNVHADNAREILKESARPGLSTDRRAVTAQQATALALLAIAAEIRRAGAGGLGAPVVSMDISTPGICGRGCKDEYGFPDTCEQPAGHSGKCQPGPAAPRCNEPIQICQDAGEHNPVCLCQLAAGHDGGHHSGPGSQRGKR